MLGPVELCYDGAAVVVTESIRALLGLLARTPGEEVDTDTIIAALWSGRPPEDARKQVSGLVTQLRKALRTVARGVDPAGVVATTTTGCVLTVQPSHVDMFLFERLFSDSRRALAVGQPELALHRAEAALSLWRGNAFDGFDESFLQDEVARLEELRVSAREARVDALLALHAPGVPMALVAELERLVATHLHREHLWAQLMTVLVRLGRRSDALAVHRRAQEQLAKRLRVQPGPELRAIETAVIDHDPRLLGVPLRPTVVPAALAATVPPCVGREQEVEWLSAALDLAATRRAQGRLIVGPTGMGKSRLLAQVAQLAADRGVAVRYWRADARGIDAHEIERDRLNLVIVEDLDQAQSEDVERVITFIQGSQTRPVLTLVSCRDVARVGDLAGLPKLALSTLDNPAVAGIVRDYAPSASEKTALGAVAGAAGVPAKVHRLAAEWAFARAGRRIDRAVAESAEPRRTLGALRDEVVAGALELAHVRSRARLLRPGARTLGSPYPGLAGFGPADGELFHGRERVVAQVLARLVEAPLLALVGEPGSGRTSLLRAGVLPALAAGLLPGSAGWRQIVVTPSTAGNLADALRAVPAAVAPAEPTRSNPLATPTALLPFVTPSRPSTQDRAEERVESDPVEELLDAVADFSESTEPIAPAPVLAPAAGLPAPRPPAATVPTQQSEDGPAPTLVVVDQFEEFFALLDDRARAEFLEALVAATRTGRVLLSMRADFARHCARYPRLAELVSANLFTLPSMTDDELRRAILAPAELAGLEVDPILVDRLVSEVLAGDGGLPGLAVTLLDLWHARSGMTLTVSAYQSGPSVGEAVAAYAEAVMARMPTPQARAAAPAMLAGLCVLTEDHLPVRARVSLTELLRRAGDGAAAALEVLGSAGLVAVDRETDTIQLRHDCLLTSWPRLREAVDDAAAETALRRHLRRAAVAWASGSGAPYHGARLVAALDWAQRHGAGLSTVEKDFLAAGQRATLADETKRRKRNLILWRWVVFTTLLAVLATALAAVSIGLHVRTAATAQRSDAARLGAEALAEPDLRRSLLLAMAATRLDAAQAGALRTVLRRTPDLVAMADTGAAVAATSPDGGTLAVGTADGAVLLLAAPTLNQPIILGEPGRGAVNGLAFTPDGRRLVSWGAAGITVWDVATGQPTGAPFGEAVAGRGGLLADGITLVVANGSTLAAWDIDARTPSTAYPLPPSTVDDLLVSPDGSTLVVASDGATMVYSPGDGSSWTLPGGATPLAFSPDGSTLLAATGSQVQVWDLNASPEASAPRSVAEHRGGTLAAAWAADASSFATVGADGAAVVWRAADLSAAQTFAAGAGRLTGVSFAPDGRTLYAVAGDGSVLAFDLAGGRGAATNLPDSGDALVALACGLIGRGMTPDEWHTYLPGHSFQQLC